MDANSALEALSAYHYQQRGSAKYVVGQQPAAVGGWLANHELGLASEDVWLAPRGP